MKPPRFAVLVSGGGRSLENLALTIVRGELDARIALVVSSNAKAGAIERATRLELPSVVIDASAGGPEEYSRRVFRWLGRVLNIHPSLLPAFGGKGYYGEKVHTAVLERGCHFSGCTVHYVDNEYDNGPILLQRSVPVERGDTVESLAVRVFAEECIALPEAVRMHFAGERPRGRRA
jgi:phosphoribosylglycinamide formyltransferase-1